MKRVIVANLFGLILFGLMFASVLGKYGIVTVDQYISTNMHMLREAWLDKVMMWITRLNDMESALFFSLAVLLLFVWLKWYREILFFLLVTLGATALFILVKYTVQRIRPDTAIIDVGGYAFPSGHTTMATAMAFGLYFILSDRIPRYKTVFFVIALLWALLIASTRLYLGVHWLSDLLGGFGLGLFWATAVQLAWHRLSTQR